MNGSSVCLVVYGLRWLAADGVASGLYERPRRLKCHRL